VSQLTGWTSYNPYLPLMDLFGLPRARLGTAAGLPSIIGDPRVYTSLFTIALLAVSFALMAKHSIRACEHCRARAARMSAIAVSSPIIGFPLVLGITDPAVIAVTILALAFLSRGWLLRTALAVAAGCALKYTAWPQVPVFAVMAWARYSPRAAVRFTLTTLVSACALALAAAPNALSNPGSVLQNTIDYPLGLTKIKTVAASPLPGHLLASTGRAGHAAAVAILCAAAAAFAVWLVRRPPRTYQAVAVRLAVAYILMFTLAPATRYGYYIYPLALLFWIPLSDSTTDTGRPRLTVLPRPRRQ
jgi:phosphatidylinositol alpha-1,6-mannosyltransferase